MDFVDDVGLIDFGFSGYSFTWNSKRSGRANIHIRLDHDLVNSDWRILFPKATISHLPPPPASSHCSDKYFQIKTVPILGDMD